jgi:hypothetical protein
MSKISSDLKKYTVIQIFDFVNTIARDEFVSKKVMRQLKIGVENICLGAFGEENLKAIKKEVPKIIRASLNTGQMGLGNKVLKFFDTRRKKRSEEIYSIFTDILNRDKWVSSLQSDIVKHSWLDKIKSQREAQSKQKVVQ